MSIDFDITSNIESLEDYLDDMKKKVVVQSAKAAINKTLITARKESVRIVAARYKTGSSKSESLTKKSIKERMKLKRASGSLLSELEGSLWYSGRTISILKFVRGSKEIIKQKGVKQGAKIRKGKRKGQKKRDKRRKLKVEIVKGKSYTLKGAFIQKANTKQVFKGKRGDGFKNQAVGGVGIVMMRPHNKAKILKLVSRKFQDTLEKELNFRLDKLARKQRASRMKKV